jgi:hypothetical protein
LTSNSTPQFSTYYTYESKIRLKATRSEELVEEGAEQPLVEVVVDLAAVDALRQQSDQSIPRNLKEM